MTCIGYMAGKTVRVPCCLSRTAWLDTGIRDPLNVLIWSKTGPTLAIGSYRGNLMIYNHKTARKVPVIGKHSKAITCGAWSSGNLLALGSEDRTLSISNLDGDTLRVATLRAEPQDIQVSPEIFYLIF